jgi:hypothetical protein
MKSLILIATCCLLACCGQHKGNSISFIGNSISSSVAMNREFIGNYTSDLKSEIAIRRYDSSMSMKKVLITLGNIGNIQNSLSKVYHDIYEAKKAILNLKVINENENGVTRHSETQSILYVDFNKIVDKGDYNLNLTTLKKDWDEAFQILKSKYGKDNYYQTVFEEFDNDIDQINLEGNMQNDLTAIFSIENKISQFEYQIINILKSTTNLEDRYSFNKITVLAIPSKTSVRVGEDIEYSVMFAAIDSERELKIDRFNGTLVSNKNGIAAIRTKATKKGKLKILGSAAIQDKFGLLRYQQYETEVLVTE